ncbi:MAG: DUF456 domain-containing protein [Alphaproteobacteria bacterium]|nr:DUF456 domain-containing protein [Alphaproteobacteria bacterium]
MSKDSQEKEEKGFFSRMLDSIGGWKGAVATIGFGIVGAMLIPGAGFFIGAVLGAGGSYIMKKRADKKRRMAEMGAGVESIPPRPTEKPQKQQQQEKSKKKKRKRASKKAVAASMKKPENRVEDRSKTQSRLERWRAIKNAQQQRQGESLKPTPTPGRTASVQGKNR